MKTGNLDGQGIAQLQNYKFQMLSSAPTTAEAIFYYDTTLHSFRYYNGTEWIDGTKFAAGLGINATALASGTIAVSTTIASKTDIGDGSIIFQKNGTAFSTATANQTSTVTVNYTIPTSASDINAVPNSRTINGHTLTADVTLTASDVGALPSTTTITDLADTTQMAAINSGVTTTIVTQVGTNATDISTINGLIPAQATTANQLADKSFVNSSVQTATANFRGNWASWSDVPTSANSYPEDYAGSRTPTVNDYLVVQDASGYTGQTLSGTWRFKYSGTWSTDGKAGWLPEYQVNETPMTAAQLAALNSGITAAGVTQIATNTSAIAGKQDTLIEGANITISGNTISAIDTIYTLPAATTNTLGGIKVGSNLSIDANGVLSADAQSITVDTTLSTTSTNPAQNKVITSAIQSNTSAIAAKSSVTFVDWTV